MCHPRPLLICLLQLLLWQQPITPPQQPSYFLHDRLPLYLTGLYDSGCLSTAVLFCPSAAVGRRASRCRGSLSSRSTCVCGGPLPLEVLVPAAALLLWGLLLLLDVSSAAEPPAVLPCSRRWCHQSSFWGGATLSGSRSPPGFRTVALAQLKQRLK